MSAKLLGILGGAGPMATTYFMELIITMTKADCDQEHMNMIVYNIPSIPDRTQYILNETEDNPIDYLLDIEHRLEKDGAQIIAIPCITAHYWWRTLKERSNVVIVHFLNEIRDFLLNNHVKCIGIMATSGTIQANLLQTILEEVDITVILPSIEEQKKVMDIIYGQIKANKSVDYNEFQGVVSYLQQKGAEKILLACTELSLVKKQFNMDPVVIDAMEILAKRCIELCGLMVKQDYRDLFGKCN